MPLEGTLTEFGMIEIFQIISQQKKTGILTVYSERETITVTFLDGSIVAASTNNMTEDDKLGTFLVKNKYISEETLKKALGDQEEYFDRLGQLLVKKSLITAKTLQEALQNQLIQLIKRLFKIEKGFYHFKPEDKVYYDTENIIPIPAETLLMEGMKIQEEKEEYEKIIPSLETIYRTRLTPERVVDEDGAIDILATKQKMQLSSAEKQVLALVDGAKTVNQIIENAPLPQKEVLSVLTSLIKQGYIEELKPAEEKTLAEFEKPALDIGKYLSYLLIPLMVIIIIVSGFNPSSMYRNLRRATPILALKIANSSRMDKIINAALLYFAANQFYPANLTLMVEQKYISSKDTIDPWGNKYLFDVSGEMIKLVSAGADGKINTGDDIEVSIPKKPAETLPVNFFPHYSLIR